MLRASRHAAVPQLRSAREEAAAHSWLMVVDQYGNLHPPSGTARAMLVETGWAALRVLIHDEGEVRRHTASELAPMVPRLAELLGDGAANGTPTTAQKRGGVAGGYRVMRVSRTKPRGVAAGWY